VIFQVQNISETIHAQLNRDIRVQSRCKGEAYDAFFFEEAVGSSNDTRFCDQACCFSALLRVVSYGRVEQVDGKNE
jgi:hypothetical protein